ncbi:SKP1-like protein 1B [Lolium perenne]|jgi:S-phase kinase-associated protein 1|uniref:SKP1-like protein 1B n=1 Tax=Lolium perenne TaxID=4522 RepID=UPI0021F57B93|nr:SKP1-like protein 1B [Lolium perenne]
MAAAGAGSSAAAQGGGLGREITIVSSDKHEFHLPEAVALVSGSIRTQIETFHLSSADTSITLKLLDVTATPLAMVLEYCRRKAADGGWDDRDFIGRDVRQGLLYDILYAATNLEVEGLVDLACKRVAEMIRGKPPAEIRRMFGIEEDGFTPEQRDEIRRDNSWIKM